jgi:hypothetical protein
MIEPDLDQRLSWLREWQGRPLGEWLATALDAFEPIAPVGAQVLYILQPTMGWMIARERLHALAQALETPEGVMAVRQLLRTDANAPKTD